MSTPAPSADDPAELTLPPAVWSAVRHAAFVGRLALLPAALFTLLAAWLNRPVDGTLVGVIVTLMALGLAALAALSLLSARRGLDAGAALLALLLAGAEAIQAFGLLGSGVGEFGGREFYVLPFLAWLLLLGGGLALFSGLVPGPVATATRAVPNPIAAAAAAAANRAASGTTGSTPPVGPPQSGSGPAAPTGGGSPSAAPPSGPRPDSPFARPAEAGAPPADAPSASGAAAPPTTASADATTTASPAESPEPGWYPSPDGTTARWWDGGSWSDDRRPLSDFEGDGA